MRYGWGEGDEITIDGALDDSDMERGKCSRVTMSNFARKFDGGKRYTRMPKAWHHL